jgi:hypothetical protein
MGKGRLSGIVMVSTATRQAVAVASAALIVRPGEAVRSGSGYHDPLYQYWGIGMLHPIYRPWPATYGAAAVHNPWIGGFAADEATGRFGRSASVQGWYRGRTAGATYNPWTGPYGVTRDVAGSRERAQQSVGDGRSSGWNLTMQRLNRSTSGTRPLDQPALIETAEGGAGT